MSVYSLMIDNELMDKCKGASWEIIRECDRLHSLAPPPWVCVSTCLLHTWLITIIPCFNICIKALWDVIELLQPPALTTATSHMSDLRTDRGLKLNSPKYGKPLMQQRGRDKHVRFRREPLSRDFYSSYCREVASCSNGGDTTGI